MSKDNTKLEIINESPKNSHKVTVNPKDIEMIFGTPDSPINNNKTDVHLINNERKHGKLPAPQPNHKQSNVSDAEQPTQPLLEPDRDRQKPPLAGPEVDDLDGDKHADATPYPGIDDGLLEPIDKPGVHDQEGESTEGSIEKEGNNPSTHDDGIGTDDGKWPWTSPGGDEADYPLYDGPNGLSPRFGVDDRPGSPVPTYIDVNTYQQKKNLAQGMMDLALLSANANQLRYVLESASTHPYYYSSLTFISLSIIFQIAVGIGLILNSRYDVNDKKEICKADKINNMTVLGIFLITIVNVFITSFSVATPTTATTVSGGPIVQQAG